MVPGAAGEVTLNLSLDRPCHAASARFARRAVTLTGWTGMDRLDFGTAKRCSCGGHMPLARRLAACGHMPLARRALGVTHAARAADASREACRSPRPTHLTADGDESDQRRPKWCSRARHCLGRPSRSHPAAAGR